MTYHVAAAAFGRRNTAVNSWGSCVDAVCDCPLVAEAGISDRCWSHTLKQSVCFLSISDTLGHKESKLHWHSDVEPSVFFLLIKLWKPRLCSVRVSHSESAHFYPESVLWPFCIWLLEQEFFSPPSGIMWHLNLCCYHVEAHPRPHVWMQQNSFSESNQIKTAASHEKWHKQLSLYSQSGRSVFVLLPQEVETKQRRTKVCLVRLCCGSIGL